MFGDDTDEEPPPWKEGKENKQKNTLDEINVGYHTHDYEGPGWWLGVGSIPTVRALEEGPYETKEDAMRAAEQVVGEGGEVNLWATAWKIDPPNEYRDYWGVYQDPTSEADSKEEAVSIALGQAAEKDEIHIRYDDKETQKLSVEEARELVS